MKLKKITCPSCAANITIKDESDIVKCEYCGAELLLEDEKSKKSKNGIQIDCWGNTISGDSSGSYVGSVVFLGDEDDEDDEDYRDSPSININCWGNVVSGDSEIVGSVIHTGGRKRKSTHSKKKSNEGKIPEKNIDEMDFYERQHYFWEWSYKRIEDLKDQLCGLDKEKALWLAECRDRRYSGRKKRAGIKAIKAKKDGLFTSFIDAQAREVERLKVDMPKLEAKVKDEIEIARQKCKGAPLFSELRKRLLEEYRDLKSHYESSKHGIKHTIDHNKSVLSYTKSVYRRI